MSKTIIRRRRPTRMGKGWLCGGLVLIFACPVLAHEPEKASRRGPTPAGIIYDVAIDRPLGLVETVAGVAVSAVAYPVALSSGQGQQVLERCVTEPGRRTFVRSLGDFRDQPRNACSPLAFSVELTQLTLAAALRPIGWIFGGSPLMRNRDRDELPRGSLDGVR